MIFGHISQLQDILPLVSPPLQRALAHLRDTDFEAKPAGTYDLEGKDIFVQVLDITTQPIANCRAEVHREYADVQFLVRGAERMGVAAETGRNTISEDHLDSRDLRFYADVSDEAILTFRPGSFAIFMPADVHRPGAAVDSPMAIRKVVMKVRASLIRG